MFGGHRLQTQMAPGLSVPVRKSALRSKRYSSMLGPFVWFGWLSRGIPKPAGQSPIAIADIQVPIAPPFGNGARRPVAAQIWYPLVNGPPKPLIIYVPVWASVRSDNSVVCANLASHGFIVVGIDDIIHDPLPPNSPASYAELRQILYEIETDAQRDRILSVVGSRVDLQVAKLQSFLDALDPLPASWPAEAVFDADRIGIFGASFGGAAAVEFAQSTSRRIAAIVNLDGWLQGTAAVRPIESPFAEFNSTRGMPPPDAIHYTNPMKRFFATIQAKSTIIVQRQLAMRDDCIRVSIEGADHADFYDKLYSPERWKQWRPWRPRIIRPERLRTVLDAYLVAFFETYLLGKASPLLKAGASPYPEVTCEVGRAPTPPTPAVTPVSRSDLSATA